MELAAAPDATTEIVASTEIVAPTECAATTESVANESNSVPKQSWLHPFLVNPKGLQNFAARLARDTKACIATEFHNCFAAVYLQQDAEQETFIYPDFLGFHETFKQWRTLAQTHGPQSKELEIAFEKVETKLVRCFKDLYYVGPLDLPAKHFCGAVDVNAMFRKGEFHGYNERSLSLPQAKDLHHSMASGYKSIAGLETIFFMAKQPLAAIASQLVPAWNAPVQTVADKLSLLQSFAALSFEEDTDVPQLFIPCCGEQKKKIEHPKPLIYTDW